MFAAAGTTMADEKCLPAQSTVGDLVQSSDDKRRHDPNHDSSDTDGDEALKAAGRHAESIIIDGETDRRLLRRIDLMMMPLLCVVYGLNYLDKTTLSYASITGIQRDIGLREDNYSWLGSIFYFGVLGALYPAARLLQRLPLSKVCGICVVLWGIVLTCFAAVHNFGGAVTIRLLLGIFESTTMVGWTLLTSQWYKKEEQSLRVAWWVSFNGLAQIFGGLVAYGFAHGSEIHGYSVAPWKIIYIFTGVLTIVFGVTFLFVVPDNQLNASWLSERDRVLAIERVRPNQQGIGNKHFKLYQFKEALSDPITWAFCLVGLVGDIPNGGISNFFSLIIESFGYDAQRSLLLGCGSGAVETASILAWGYASKLTGNRILCSLGGPVLALIGSSMLIGFPLSNIGGRLAGYYITQAFIPGIIVVFYLIASNVAGYTKKTTVAALFFIFYCAGNIIGPQTFRAKDAPQYRPAKITLVICWAIFILDLLFIYGWYRWQNGKKANVRSKPGYTKLKNQEFLDLTDRENAEFVYSL